jgi:lipopolysaccharide/colanic/teichoic acid biosynthesis glycosyltransferase
VDIAAIVLIHLEYSMKDLSHNIKRSIGSTRLQISYGGNYGPAAAESAIALPFLSNNSNAIPYRDGGIPYLVRAAEILIALTGLILTAPIMLVIAVIIKLGSPGPALFFQNRLGRNGKYFTFVKFRTLYADAKQRFPQLYAYQYTKEELGKLHFKVEDDPRVTPQGKWLRKSTLDELPNFWNLLTGDMSLVGPRPEIPEMLPYYDREMLMKFAVRPGITGLAQISGRGRLSFHDTVACDLDYVRTRSLITDLKIILKTFHKIIVRDGAF